MYTEDWNPRPEVTRDDTALSKVTPPALQSPQFEAVHQHREVPGQLQFEGM